MALAVPVVGAAVALALVCAFLRLFRIGRRAPGLPPGPPTIPILGNLHLVSCDAKYFRRKLTIISRCHQKMVTFNFNDGYVRGLLDSRLRVVEA